MRTALYTRSSIGDETSTDRQERILRSFCEARSWPVVAAFTDGTSGWSRRERLTGWNGLTAAVDASEVDAVVVFSISRAARNTIALLTFADLCTKRGVTFESATEPIGGDYGRVFMAILGSLAELESHGKSERAKAKQADLKAAGQFQGGIRPFGYRIERREDGAYAVPDPQEAALLRDAALLLLNGGSLRSLLRQWSDTGVLTTKGNAWTRAHLRALMLRPLDGILEASDHRRLVRLFESRERPEPRRGKYLLTGLLECGRCQNPMVGRPNRGAPSYACVATGVVHLSAKARNIEEFVTYEASLRRPTKAAVLTDPSEPLLAERAQVEDRLAQLGEDYAGGDAFAMKAATVLRARLVEIDAELDAVAPAVDVPEAAGNMWADRAGSEHALDFWRDYREAPEVRAWLESLVETVTLNPAGRAGKWDPERVTITWRRGVEIVGWARSRTSTGPPDAAS